MASTSEQGHSRNVANFDELIINCSSYGTAYNPTKASLKIPAMQAQSTAAKNSITTINTLNATYKNAVAARVKAFSPLDKLVTRINNAIKTSDISQENYGYIKPIINKIQGRRASEKKTEEEKKVAKEAGSEIIEISTSQMSYDNKLDNLDKLIKLLTPITQYNPNEADLKITTLNTLYNDLKTKNLAVINAQIPINNARITRNDLMYKDSTGMIDVALDVKNYIKSLFGTTSPQYKAISGLEFKKYKN